MSTAMFIESQKIVKSIPPGVIKDNAAFTSYVIDTALAGGADELVFKIALGSIDADLAVLKVQQSDGKSSDTALDGNAADLLDVLAEMSAAPGDSDDNKNIVVRIDLKGEHKRYMQLLATAGDGAAGTYLSAIAEFTNVGVPEEDMGALAMIKG